ncbi:putative DNA-binding domain-containing protein [Shewanella sp. Isolate7]|uniref:HvfC family RiPP maturation protein n=1 Tax=Shewanella sp. Isolate7 TaxID=2908528 RepID=UPI001EFD3898|nr:putative DNA-binding domain-containing protein [Shewanella sp. Isolate7]MCG9721586.1 putative DNA-binding domain-containing protein [Shewanella sp. Isolate7]
MSFTQVQQSFIDYIKDPSSPLPQGTDARRMGIYRELFFNNVKGFVASGFPVLCSLYEEEIWQALVQRFFATHDCQTPIFIEIAQEFLLFLQNEYQMNEQDPAFMLELAHYEWLELVVATAPDDRQSQRLDAQSIEARPLALSLAARVAQYHFEVQRISPDYRPEVPIEQPNFFCLYRDSSDEVCFLQLNPLAAQVLAYIGQQDGVGFTALCDWLTQLYQQMPRQQIVEGCRQLLADMAERGIVVAAR